jgi:hypothetical protein
MVCVERYYTFAQIVSRYLQVKYDILKIFTANECYKIFSGDQRRRSSESTLMMETEVVSLRFLT